MGVARAEGTGVVGALVVRETVGVADEFELGPGVGWGTSCPCSGAQPTAPTQPLSSTSSTT